MKTSTSQGNMGYNGYLDFADDLALLSHTQQQMQKMTSVAAASTAVGLNIYKGKSKILRYNTACTNPITPDEGDLEDVNKPDFTGGRNQEVDRTHIEKSIQLHHKASLHM
ncbi:unnamed protein product [Schistosoma margrebowiei]|uniref:Uncharacterized protein n=1 Tax=Schistosoma margrebowiei TaxID=48269 RepID=A0A183MUL0_9TREM|nr:unnamed protein product [Schistosoma margrebowiei]